LSNAAGGPPVLTAWLYSVARRTAIDVIRKESRRQLREQIALEMNNMNATSADWTHIEPLLDDAMAALDETDRSAILLRYFENKSLREVGDTLNISDDAAQKRVSRAVEHLRAFFSKRKITIGASGLAVLISANAVQAAPVGLAATISAAAVLAGTAVHTSTTIATIKIIAMTTLQKTFFAAALTAAIGTGIFEARQASQLREQNQIFQQQQTPLAEQIRQLQRERDDATNQLAGLIAENTQLKSGTNEDELLKLRGEVGVLHRQLENANQNAQTDEKKLADESSAKAQFDQHESATINANKQLGLALRMFLADNANQYPTNEGQFINWLRWKSTIDASGLGVSEFNTNGAANDGHSNGIEFRERLARQAPDGTWHRTYGFSDGSVHTATSIDGNFDEWEKVNTYSPPSNVNQ